MPMGMGMGMGTGTAAHMAAIQPHQLVRGVSQSGGPKVPEVWSLIRCGHSAGNTPERFTSRCLGID